MAELFSYFQEEARRGRWISQSYLQDHGWSCANYVFVHNAVMRLSGRNEIWEAFITSPPNSYLPCEIDCEPITAKEMQVWDLGFQIIFTEFRAFPRVHAELSQILRQLYTDFERVRDARNAGTYREVRVLNTIRDAVDAHTRATRTPVTMPIFSPSMPVVLDE